MMPRVQLSARCTPIAAIELSGIEAVEELGEFTGNDGFPYAGHSAEEQCVRKIARLRELL